MRLSRLHRLCIYSTFAVLLVTGLIWVGIQYGLRPGTNEFGAPIQIDILPLSMKIHGAAAMIFLILFGTLIPRHMRGGWRSRRNLRTGLSMAAASIVLIVTGYLLYYSGGEMLRTAASYTHTIIGIVTLPLLVWHVTWRIRMKGKDF